MKTGLALIVAGVLYSSAVAAQSITPVADPIVRDNTGKFVGHILGSRGNNAFDFLFTVNGSNHILLSAETVPGNGLRWIARSFLFYQSTNCTGQAYASDPGVGEVYSTIDEANTLYLSAAHATPQPLTVNSVKIPGNPCSPPFLTFHTDLVPVNPTISLDSVFQLPLTTADIAQQNAPAVSGSVLIALAAVLAVVGLLFLKR